MLAAFTTVAAAGDASLTSAPCELAARSISLASSGEATRTASPSITSSLGGAIAGPGCKMDTAAALLATLARAANGQAVSDGVARRPGEGHGRYVRRPI